MCNLKPSEPFEAFEAEAITFDIMPNPLSGGALRFEAKQRMIDRAEGFAIREAYLVGWWWLFIPGATGRYFEGLQKYEKQLAANPIPRPDLDTSNLRHRAEICINLYARTIQQFILRRLYTATVMASIAAVVVSFLAVWYSRR